MPDVATVLFREEDIERRVREMAEEISADHEGRSLVLISVLKGAAIFLADLFRQVRVPVRVDFMSISAYGGEGSDSGVVRIVKDLEQDIGGEDVLVVEDIIDTGLTLSYLLSTLRARDPRSIEICTLLDKTARRIAPLEIRYRGFECPDRFVVGYGLDVAQRYRNLRDILELSDLGQVRAHPELLEPFVTV